MVLGGIEVLIADPRAIGHDHAVHGGSVMVGGGKFFDVESTKTTGGKNDGLGSCYVELAGLHIIEDGAGAFSFFIQKQGAGVGELQHGFLFLSVAGLIPYHPHDLCSRHITCRMHTFAGRPSKVLNVDPSVGKLIEHHAQLFQPGDGQRRVLGQGRQQIRLVGKVAPADSIEIMIIG